MAKLIYSANVSLDGCIADKNGNFDWSEPDEEVHSFINDLLCSVGTHLYGRRMYETMAVWEDPKAFAAEPPYVQVFGGIWRAADKVVYSTTLKSAASAKTRIEREFIPEAVRLMKANAARDVLIGGANLASHAIKAGLVDEYYLFLVPVGGGNRFFPENVRLNLELRDERQRPDLPSLRRVRERGGRANAEFGGARQWPDGIR